MKDSPTPVGRAVEYHESCNIQKFIYRVADSAAKLSAPFILTWTGSVGYVHENVVTGSRRGVVDYQIRR